MKLWMMTVSVSSLLAPLMVLADTLKTSSGVISMTPLIHASVELTYRDVVIQIDPWSAGELSKAKPADFILITDDPDHHLDPVAIDRLLKPGGVVVLPPSAQGKYKGKSIPLASGRSITMKAVKVDAIPAYDLTPGEPSHPKGKANGYVVTLGGKRLFFAGVTECVQEIEALKAIDVAFLPMNLPLGRMTPAATAACARSFSPRVIYPYHYDQQWASRAANPSWWRVPSSPDVSDKVAELRRLLVDSGIEVRTARWYPEQ
jgi:L-ascorbate metabolism protein UlaG (beta-lactamase superfamily)